MRKLKRVLVATCIALGISTVLPAQPASPPACPTGSVCVFYTSKLLGYIRDDNRASDETKNFEASIQEVQKRYPSALVVAMGDNLAPEYASRFEPDPNDTSKMRPKLRTGLSGALKDNVLDELVKFYDVIVPGKEEFYFGAERLRVLALTTPKLNAANMAESPVYNMPEPEPNEPKPRAYLDSHPKIKIFDGGHLVLKRTGNRKPAYSVEINGEAIPKLQICKSDDLAGCSRQGLEGKAVDGASGFKIVTYDLSTVSLADNPSGSRRLICFIRPPSTVDSDWQGHDDRVCHAVLIDEALFQDFPYSVPKDKDFVVFPVVGEDVKQLVSRANRVWGPNPKEITAEVAIWDPVAAVRQAYYECRMNKNCTPSMSVVVLAQMSRVAAQKLADEILDLKAKVIISKAEPTGSPYGKDMDYASAGLRAPVIATRSIYTAEDACPNKPSGATLRNPLHLIAIYSETRLDHIKTPLADHDWCVPRPVVSPPKPGGREFWLDKRVAENPWYSPSLEHFIAEQMRAEYGGDAGLVSLHGIFRGQEIQDPDMPANEKAERTIWEGAHVTRVRLSGKNLRKALDAQKDAPSDRQLVMSGIAPNGEKDYYINSKPLLDDSYYTVIAPDAVVYGDPNYVALSDDTFQQPEVLSDSVAGFVCSKLGTGQDKRACPVGNLSRAKDTLLVRQPLPFRLRNYLLSVIAPGHHDPLPNLKEKCENSKPSGKRKPSAECIEKTVQFRHLWFAKLQKNDLSYSIMKPNTADRNLQNNFAGVTNPNVVKAHLESYSVDHNLRLGVGWRHFAVGAEETVQFARTRQGNTNGGPDSVNLTANRGAVGPFFEFAFAHNAAPNWRLILRPVTFSDNFARTPTTINGTSPTKFTLSLPAQRSLASAVGFRFEAPQRKDSLYSKDGNAFIEGGYKTTLSINLPAAITLNPGSPTQTVCSLAAATFAQCAASVTAGAAPNAVIASFQNDRQQGFYWTGIYSFPLGKHFTYKFASDGDFRAGDNLSSETKYAVTLDNYLQTRIWGNFSLAPHMGWFLYENQVEHHTLTRRTYEVNLTYTFDWHSGMGWRSFFMKPETAK